MAPGANASLAVAVALAILLAGCFCILYLPRVSEDMGRTDHDALDLLTAALVSKSLNETRHSEPRHSEPRPSEVQAPLPKRRPRSLRKSPRSG